MQLRTNMGGTTFNWLFLEGTEGALELSGDPLCSYSQFLKVVSGQHFSLVPKRYGRLSEHFVSSSFAAPLLMPRARLKSNLQEAERLLASSLVTDEDRHYLTNWCRVQDFLDAMQPAMVDAVALRTLVTERDAEGSKTLLSFLPDRSGFAARVRYSTCDTVTGRAKVVCGPQVLTAHHGVRKCLRSSFNGGAVLAIDFTSVEPRVALTVAGQSASEDVYSEVLEEFPEMSRPTAKLVTLAALYGGRETRLTGIVGDLGQARKAMSFVRAHFRVEELERRLADQAANSIVRNVLGRPLREATKNPRIRTNHFLQSSAAELAALLFAELCDKFPEGLRPLFVIHDALLVDVGPQVAEEFAATAKKIVWKGTPMPVKIETLSPI